ncbi:C-type lectin domain-containing protein [Nannocystaceae bacterium ST9]
MTTTAHRYLRMAAPVLLTLSALRCDCGGGGDGGDDDVGEGGESSTTTTTTTTTTVGLDTETTDTATTGTETSESDTTTGPLAVCGDGVVEADEQCDWEHPLCVECEWQPGNDHPCIAPEVFVLTYDTPGSETFYADPDRLSACLLRDFRAASSFHGYADPNAAPYLRFHIVDSAVVAAQAPQIDGMSKADYAQIYADHDICARAEAGEFDEVWMWGDPMGGFPERVMTGPNFVHEDGTGAPTCARQIATMGFNYGINSSDDLVLRSQAMHSWGHRIEDMLVWFFEQTTDKGATNGGWWEQFDGQGHRYKDASPPLATTDVRCGNVHFPPNATNHYQYDSTDVVQSYCQSWTLAGGTEEAIDASTWDSTQYGYMTWWMQNIPNVEHPDGNWWRFLLDDDIAACDTLVESPPADCTPITALGDSEYLLCATPRVWEDAKDACRAIGDAWDLVAIESADENAHLAAELEAAGALQSWIGLNDRFREAEEVDAEFEWVQCVATSYTNFDSLEPSNWAGENCVELDWNRVGGDGLHGHWNDLPCDFIHPMVCEKTPLD